MMLRTRTPLTLKSVLTSLLKEKAYSKLPIVPSTYTFKSSIPKLKSTSYSETPVIDSAELAKLHMAIGAINTDSNGATFETSTRHY